MLESAINIENVTNQVIRIEILQPATNIGNVT